ncbi:hypothetical protein HDU97_000941 [Phlyctochytrium planicorne]|nr:hypothetical protein HDU97_000941 [Phlyctochytrium planicorne]
MHFSPSTIIAFLALASTYVQGHAVLKTPAPRKGMADGIGIKYIGNLTKSSPDPDFPPCDKFGKGPSTATLAAGSDLKVEWDIKINHKSDPGVKVAVQFGGVGAFETLAKGIDNNLKATTVKLPAGKTGDAVIQWQWGSDEDGGFYLGCADVTVTAGAAKLAGFRKSSSGRNKA